MLVDILKIKLKSNLISKNVGNLQELTDSIKKKGQLRPIIIDENWNVRARSQDFLACMNAGLTKVEVIQYKGLEEQEWIVIELMENNSRRDLDKSFLKNKQMIRTHESK